MSKKKTKDKKAVQMLSPENYIRQRSRSLPIYKCWAFKKWQEIGKTQIIVSRKHVNGNISFCFYLVDLFCLGVKDTFFQFNTDESDLIENISNEYESVEYEEISYTLAHNIIFSAIEFAKEYDFQPHKDFIRTTKFFLEEDDDAIELIDIECGKDGKPLYIDDGEDKAQAKRILAQLKKTAGQGNYDYILSVDDSDSINEYEEDEELEFHDPFDHLPIEIQDQIKDMNMDELVEFCLSLFVSEDEESMKVANDLADYIISPFQELTEEEEDMYFQVEDYFEEIELIPSIPEEYFEEAQKQISLFGHSNSLKGEIKKLMADDIPSIDKIEKLLNKTPNIPILHYLRITSLDMDPDKSYQATKIAKKQFPNIPVFKILNYDRNMPENPKFVSIYELHKKFFGNKQDLLEIEAVELILCFLNIILRHNKISMLPYLDGSIQSSNLSHMHKNKIRVILYMTKMAIIARLNESIKAGH
mgnify:CR=1 FL=1